MRSRSATTFGRDTELRQLLELVDLARSGNATSVLVHGEAGIGKTRLVSELVASLRAHGDLVVVGHGVHLSEGEVPFGVLTESLRDLVRTVGVERVRELVGTDAEYLTPLVPALRSGPPGDANRAGIIGGTANLVDALAVDQLVCWVVEDLQWIDTATRDAFAYLARFLPSARLLLVATWRDEDDGPTRPQDYAEEIELPVLRGAELDGLVAEVASALDAPDRRRLAELSQGLPFLVEELAQSWRPGAGVDPAYLRRLVLTRLSDLSASARALVELAAVGEGHLDIRLLEAGLGVEPTAIRAAADARLLETAPADDTLRFRHALLREAILEAVPPGDRRRLHQRWAEALEADDRVLSASARMVALATHWHEAGVPERALPALARSARAAHAIPAPSVEYAAITKILSCWDRVPDAAALTGSTRERMLVDRVRLGMGLGDFDAVSEMLQAERERAAVAGDPVGAAWAALHHLVFDDNFRKTVPDPTVVATLFGGELDDPRVVSGLMLVADARLPRDLSDRATVMLEWVRDNSSERSARLQAMLMLAAIEGNAGEFAEALAAVQTERARWTDADIDEQWLIACHEAWLQILLGRPAEAIAILERELGRVPRPSTVTQFFQTMAENLAHAYLAAGRWSEALELAASALLAVPELDEAEPVLLPSDFLRAHLAAVHERRGDLAEARRICCPIQGHAGPAPWEDRLPMGEVLAQLAAVSAAEGDLARCRAELAGAWELTPAPKLAEQLPFAVLTGLRAESTLVDRHDPVAAAESAAVVERILATAEPLPRPGPRGAAWWAEARAHATRSRGGDTAADWAPAVAGWRECGQPYDVATCLRFLGEAALREGDTNAAAEALAEAYEICVELGAGPLGEDVLAVARRGRLPIGPAAGRSGPGPLTAREVEVLALVAEGRTNQQIASELFMSPKTVSVHVSRILTKLGAANRTEAAAAGRRTGLVG